MAVFTAVGAAVTGALTASLGAATATFIGGAAAALLQVAVGVGVSMIAQSLMGGPQHSGFSLQGQIRAGEMVPRSIMFGYSMTAGSRVYQGEWGQVDDTPNAYTTQVIAVNDKRLTGIAEYWVNGEQVTLGTTADPGGKGYPVIEYRKDGKDYLWFKFLDGTQTTADSFLVSTFGSDPERPITSTFVGTGIAYVIATALVEPGLFQNGFPSYKFATLGTPLFDLSDPGQDPDDESTWGGDGDNLPAVQIYNLIMGIRFDGQWLYGMQNTPLTRMPASWWIDQIEKCRDTIEGPDGPEPMYRAGGELFLNAPLNAALEALLASCSGRLSEIGGTYKLHVGEPGAAVATLTDSVVLSTEDQSFTPFFGLADTINGISAQFPSPTDGWVMRTAPPIYDLDFEHEDGDRRLPTNVQLEFVPYSAQVQRLMLSGLREARRARRHTFTLPPRFWLLEPGDIVSWSSVRNGYSNKLFRVDGITAKGNMDVVVDFTEVDPADYSWNVETDYTPITPAPTVIVRPPSQEIVAWDATGVSLLDMDGEPRIPGIQITVDPDLVDVPYVQIQIRYDGDTFPFYDRSHPYAEEIAVSEGLIGQTDYEVRARYVPGGPRTTTWTGWTAVTTPAVVIGPINFDSLGSDLADLEDWITTGGEDIPAVQDLDIIVGDATAGGRIRFNTFASPGGGWDARFGIQVRATLGDNWTTAAFYLDANSTTDISRAVFNVDEFVIWDGVTTIPPFYISGSGLYLGTDVVVDGDLLITGTVTTPKVQNNAITEGNAVDVGAGYQYSTTSTKFQVEEVVLSITKTIPTGYFLGIDFAGRYGATNANLSAFGNVRVRLLDNSTALALHTGFYDEDGFASQDGEVAMVAKVDGDGASHTITVRMTYMGYGVTNINGNGWYLGMKFGSTLKTVLYKR